MIDNISLPICDSLKSSKKILNGSFHALPIQNLNKNKELIMEESFRSTFNSIFNLDLSITTPFFDSLSSPNKCIEASSRKIEKIYNSDLSLFVTCGSTLSNHIVINGLCCHDDKIICQKGVHQSIHFSLKSLSSEFKLIDDVACNSNTDSYHGDAEKILEELKNAEEKNMPYKTLIINSQSYDGVCYNLESFLEDVGLVAKRLQHIIIDEAWGAWSTFDKAISGKSAVHNARVFSKKLNKDIIVIHSIHKSLFALRQASLINIYGSEECQKKLSSSHFKHHTTSPSYPILASIELAVIHANEYGHKYSQQASGFVDKVGGFVNEELSYFGVSKIEMNSKYFINDPTKLWVSCRSSLFSGEKIREYLFNNYGLYVSRYSDDSILFNFHYGVNEKIVNDLMKALLKLDKKIKESENNLNISVGEVSEKFFIQYPPGIPILTPGQKVCDIDFKKVQQSLLNNTSIIIVEG